MKNRLLQTMAATILVLGSLSGAYAASDRENIHAVLEAYEQLLNACDVAGIVNLYDSAGTTTINATGEKVAEANQELFVFQKAADGEWRIARYSFSTTNPPR